MASSVVEEASRRWDSRRRRWSARSFLRREASVVGSSSSAESSGELFFPFVFISGVVEGRIEGGFEDCVLG